MAAAVTPCADLPSSKAPRSASMQRSAKAKYLAKYYFRGLPCPWCRSDLIALANVYDSLAAEGIDLMVITAQPGSEEALKADMKAHHGCDIPYKLVSDPEHKLLEESAGDIYIKLQDDPWFGTSVTKFNVIQPALVVRDLATQQLLPELTWSWRTLLKDQNPEKNLQGKSVKDTTLVPNPNRGVRPKKLLLMALRPDFTDLASAIHERRAVAIHEQIATAQRHHISAYYRCVQRCIHCCCGCC